MPQDDILRPDDHDLFKLVSAKLNQRNPIIPMEVIAESLCVTVDELCRWVLAYREPKAAIRHTPAGARPPRDPALRREYNRLMRRQESLVTVANEAPRQLETVQTRLASLERMG